MNDKLPAVLGHAILLLAAVAVANIIGGVPLYLVLSHVGKTTEGVVISREGHGAERTRFILGGQTHERLYPPSGHIIGQAVTVHYLTSHLWFSTTVEPRSHLRRIIPFVTVGAFLMFGFLELMLYLTQHPHVGVARIATAPPRVGITLAGFGALIGSVNRTIAPGGAIDEAMIYSNIVILIGCYLVAHVAWVPSNRTLSWKLLFKEPLLKLGLALIGAGILVEAARR